jgi:hypothetical protein
MSLILGVHLLDKLRGLKSRLIRYWNGLKSWLLRRREGEALLNQRYRTLYGKDLNLTNPHTFSEKLFHRMIMLNRRRNPAFTRLTDKLLVREHVQQRIGGDYLVDLFWHGADPNKIPFDRLPSKCVAKTNHWSGSRNMILDRPIDRAEVVNELIGLLSLRARATTSGLVSLRGFRPSHRPSRSRLRFRAGASFATLLAFSN